MTKQYRRWCINWVYAMVALHLLAGMLLPLVGGATVLDAYHRGIEAHFWGAAAPAAARAQQLWWIALFGPTLQAAALWMGALAHLGARLRSSAAWGWLIAGLVLWAPQDMWTSLRADCWPHLWIDALALASLLPPLLWLWQHDRRAVLA